MKSRTYENIKNFDGHSQESQRLTYQDVDTAKIQAPQHMGVGTMEIAGVPRAVILNLQSGATLEYLSNNVLDKYRECFQRMTSPQDVELVITGFTPDCRPLFNEFFPLAKIVIDRSHVERLANDAMEAVRKKVRGEIVSRRSKSKLMSDKVVLFTRRSAIDSWAATQLKAWRFGAHGN